MKRFLSVLLTLAMVASLIPAMPVIAAEMSGITIEYPTAITGSGQTTTAFTGALAPDAEISYANSSGRIQWLGHTTKAASWNKAVLSLNAGKEGQYGAYKIRVPKAGDYNVTVQYRTRNGGAEGEMYILPISAKDDIGTALSSATSRVTVDFGTGNDNSTDTFHVKEPFVWNAPSAGEYIVVWKAKKEGSLRPANLIFNGGTEKAPLSAESMLVKTTLNLANAESTTIATTSVIMSDLSKGGDSDIAGLTYESSDENVVTVSGNTITATGEGTAKIYTKNGDFILAENEIKVSNIEYSGVFASYPTFTGDGGYANGAFASPADIDYEGSGWRVDWYDYTGTWNDTSAPSWNAGAAAFLLNKGEYAAYKINVPEKGFYDVTLTYLVRTSGCIADMYLLPGNTAKKDIAAALETAEPFITDVNFLCTAAGVADKTKLEIKKGFNAETAGEFIVVWKRTDSNEKVGQVRPVSLVFDGGDIPAVSYADFGISATLKPSVMLYMSDGSTIDGADVKITYTSSDETLLKINNETGKFTGMGAGDVTVTANIEYNGRLYTATVSKTLTGEETPAYSNAAKTYMFNKKSEDWVQTIVDEGETQPRANDVRNITYEYTDNNYAWYGTTESKYNAAYCYAADSAPTGRMRMYRQAGGWTGFRIMVPERGRYAVNLEYIKYYNGEGISDVYIIPGSVVPADAASYLTDDYCVGMINTLDPQVADLTLADSWIGEVNIPAAGEYAVIFKARSASYTTIHSLTLDGIDGMKRVDFIPESGNIDVGKSTETGISAYMLDGTEISEEEIAVSYVSEQPHIATVSDKGVITGVSEGIATVTATVRWNSDVKNVSVMIAVTDNSGVSGLELKTFANELYKGAKTRITLLAHMNSGNVLPVPFENAQFVFEGEDGVLSAEEGLLSANKTGMASVKAYVTFKGETKETNELSFDVKTGTQKRGPTIYTDEMRKNALANAKKHDWAKALAENAKKKADVFLDKIDTIYNMIEYDNLPRSFAVGLVDDAGAYECLYCGIDIRDKYGSYAWETEPFSRPWKIQCPDCKRLFPSNDFGSFYELGKDEYGKFNLARARQAHHEKFVCEHVKSGEECIHTAPEEEYSEEWYEYYGYGVEGGYLYNELYKDVGKDIAVPENVVGRWGVDDGWGYDTGEKAETGVPMRKTFIAFYNYSLWGTLKSAINNLCDAYLYTGDEKYGRGGAILIDRVADIYPSYDWTQYIEFQHSHGGKNSGKISGNIWERGNAQDFAGGYDAVWPMMEDPQVIEYLSEKAAENGLSNEKLSAEMIRKNCEDGICREIFKGAKEGKIWGNFGMYHMSVAHAAVALDSMPETEEMVEWLCQPSVATTETRYKFGKKFTVYTGNSGGEMLSKFMSEVDRDGYGAEVGVTYNQGWLTNIRITAELFYNYDKSSKLNFYNNPKFRKMFYGIFNMTMAGNYSLQLGDHYSTADTSNDTDLYNTLLALEKTGDMSFAQMYYAIKNGNVKGAYLDMFQDSETDYEKLILDYVRENGEIVLPSRNFAGYGLAVLRDGKKLQGAYEKNLKRDAWLWYGKSATSHGHYDLLQMGIDAYGFNFMPDLGYPAATLYDPNRLQWVRTTLSHNTVVVDGVEQSYIRAGVPRHFDDAGKVKLVDVEAPQVYEQTDIYRRTLVSVQVSNEVDYTVDFFRVRGGNEHIYSFHTQSFNGVTTEGLKMTAQNGGTYAGEDTEYGKDPNSQSNYTYQTLYPRGYTWLRNVQRDESPENAQFSVNFKQTDFNKQLADSKGLNLKWTALNDWTPSSVGIATAETPKLAENKNIPELDYMLVHRKSDQILDTLFTSVIQPYKGQEYIESMESIALVISDGVEGKDDTAKAVKVTLKNGRTDYIIYATNNGVTYTLTDDKVSFNFRGFVGVYSVNENGANIYSYVNDGDIIGEEETVASVSGKIVDFEKELSFDNYITVDLEREVDASALEGRYIYVDNSGKSNGAYRIESAEVDGKTAALDVGDVTLINEYRDPENLDLGFIYNIAQGDSFVIPLSETFDSSPVFGEVKSGMTTSAGSSVVFTVNATSSAAEKISYVGTHLPRGASVDAATGKVTWKPDSSQVGTHSFVITARDDSGRENSTSFEITVYGSTTGDKNGNEETPSTGISGGSAGGGGGGGGGGAAPAPAPEDSSDSTAEDETSNIPQDNGESSENGNAVGGDSNESNFTDLGNHAWASDAINALAADGIIRGTSETTFSPTSNITRADFALLLVRAFKLTSDNTENFADVSASDYFAPELAIARNSGIVGGIGENRYAPCNNITRQDMMVIVYRALQQLNVGLGVHDEPQYGDFTAVADYAKEAVTALIGAGIVNGKNNFIAPTDYTTRAEVAVLIKRILNYIK